MAKCSVFPCIMWKIESVSNYCKRKSPNFTFRSAQWKLKFLYTMNPTEGNVCQIFLKRSRNESASENLKITSFCTGVQYATEYLKKTVTLSKTHLNEWPIWECKDSEFLHTTNNMQNIWDRYFFVCIFTLEKWISPEYFPSRDEAEPSLLENSQCITSLCHDFGKLFNSHVMSDVTLISGDQKIYAHRNILSARSDVFAAMFRTDMNESTERSVNMMDIEPAILEILVRYMYTGKALNLTHRNVHKVYAAADKYEVRALKMKCGIFMVENPADENLPPANFEIDESGACSLNENVLSHFANIKAIISTEEWKKLSEVEPKFAHEAFIFFVSQSPS